MSFQEQAAQPNGHSSPGQFQHLFSATARGVAKGVTALQAVGDIEYGRAAAGALNHRSETKHVHHQVVVAESGAALAQHDLIIACFGAFDDHVLHLRRTHELRLLDIDSLAGLGDRNDQICLACQECRNLQHVGDLRPSRTSVMTATPKDCFS